MYSSIAEMIMAAIVNVTKLLVSICNEDQREMTDARSSPVRNRIGVRVWYPPKKKVPIVAENKTSTINRFL